MSLRPTEFFIRWAPIKLVLVLFVLNTHATIGFAQVAKPALQSNGKFHAPSVPVRNGEDPWGPAKNLGIAGNDSYPIPNDLLHVDLYRQSKQDEINMSTSCVSSTPTSVTCIRPTPLQSVAWIAMVEIRTIFQRTDPTYFRLIRRCGLRPRIRCEVTHCSITRALRSFAS